MTSQTNDYLTAREIVARVDMNRSYWALKMTADDDELVVVLNNFPAGDDTAQPGQARATLEQLRAIQRKLDAAGCLCCADEIERRGWHAGACARDVDTVAQVAAYGYMVARIQCDCDVCAAAWLATMARYGS